MINIIKKILKIKIFKVCLCVLENIIKSISLNFRKKIELKFYNPYDFGEKNLENYKNQAVYFFDYCKKYNIELNWKSVLELWPWWFLWFWSYIKKYWVEKYYAIDDINHFENLSKKNLEMYKLIDNTMIVWNSFDDKYVKILSYSNEGIDLSNESIDVVFSNAVYEHVSDPDSSIWEISRLTKKWWYWIHTIDFRDHIFDQQSLYFLTISDKIFNFLFKNAWAWVNRKRYSDFVKMFEKYWFEILEIEIINKFDEITINKYKNQLNKYSNTDLKNVSARFIVKKK